MYYSLIGFLALCILIIANHDILLKRIDRNSPAVQRIYYRFLLCIIAYYVTDILWGILDAHSLISALYADTVIYFLAMAAGILFWTQYVLAYLKEENRFGIILRYAGMVFCVAMFLLTIINFFTPVMFWFDETGAYHTGPMRHFMLIVQVLMFLLVSIYTLRAVKNTQDSGKRRYLTIGLFGLIMAILLEIQLFFPLLPLYSIGYMLGSCLLRTFVIEEEKREYMENLEASILREQQQKEELRSTWKLAYTDALTGVKSKLAFSEREKEIDQAIADGKAGNMAVVVFDLNGLKQINDSRGHDAGDRYIVEACRLICTVFQHSPVFRMGGDEFVAILEGQDYDDRVDLLAYFNQQNEKNRRTGHVVVAAGMTEYIPDMDNSFERVFKRADREMYRRKEETKHTQTHDS